MILPFCGDCGVEEGELHLDNCDQEKCSKCGKQVLMHGKCEGAKPEPFFSSVFSCARCGVVFPQMKMVSNEEWKFICGGTYQDNEILCIHCMDFIKEKRSKYNGMGDCKQ